MSMDNNTNIHTIQYLYISFSTQYIQGICMPAGRYLRRNSFIKSLSYVVKLLIILCYNKIQTTILDVFRRIWPWNNWYGWKRRLGVPVFFIRFLSLHFICSAFMLIPTGFLPCIWWFRFCYFPLSLRRQILFCFPINLYFPFVCSFIM